jgi:ubiquinone biosynthesis protein
VSLGWTLFSFLLWVAWARLLRRADPADVARVLRERLEAQGGVWVKAGQLLGMRSDMFPRAFCAELSRLQDRAPGFAPEAARQIVEESLGRPIEEVFSEWAAEPFAAASIGQLHRGVLRHEGTVVAVKVQRPHIERRYELDLRFVRWLVRLALVFRIAPHINWAQFYEELDRALVEELDYRFEATAIRRMRKGLKHHQGIYAPKVFTKYSARRVLCMEFVQGALMADLVNALHDDPARARAWLVENRIDPDKVARRLYVSLLRQIFDDNRFHGDLHPGNIILLKGSRLALIDFGSIGRLEEQFRERYFEFEESIANGEYAKAADILLLMQPSLPSIDLEPLKEEIVRAFRDWELRSATKGLPFALKSSAEANGRVVRAMLRYRIPATWQWLRVDRAMVTLEASLRVLAPDIDYLKLSRQAFAIINARARAKVLSARQAGNQVADGLMLAGDLMKSSLEHKVLEAEWMRRQARIFLPQMNKLDFLVLASLNVILTGSAFLVIAVAGMYVHQYGGGLGVTEGAKAILDKVPVLPAWSWTGFACIVLVSLLQLYRLQRRFRQPTPDLVSRRT